MTKRQINSITLWITFLYSIACFSSLQADVIERWYSQEQLNKGNHLFKKHCSVCHGHNAESIPNWKQLDANNNYPPPPLNGSAHSWHHDLPLLRKTIQQGGKRLGGVMPAFDQILSADEIDAVIAFFQSLWPQEVYQKWAVRFNMLPSKRIHEPNLAFLKQRLGNIDIGPSTTTPMDGMYQLRFKDKMLYLSKDGRFAFIGDMIDLKTGINISKQKP